MIIDKIYVENVISLLIMVGEILNLEYFSVDGKLLKKVFRFSGSWDFWRLFASGYVFKFETIIFQSSSVVVVSIIIVVLFSGFNGFHSCAICKPCGCWKWPRRIADVGCSSGSCLRLSGFLSVCIIAVWVIGSWCSIPPIK